MIIAKDEGICPVYMFKDMSAYRSYRFLNDLGGIVKYRVKALRLFVSSQDEEMQVDVSIFRRRWMRRFRNSPGLYWMKDNHGKVSMVNVIKHKHGICVDVNLNGDERYIFKPRWMSRKEYSKQMVHYKYFAGPLETPR